MDRSREVRASPPPELAAFCNEEHRRLVALLSLYCGNAQVAEELAQEALIRACRDWRKVQKMEHRTAWLQRVAVNLANSYFRRKAAERRAGQRLERHPREVEAAPDTATALAVREAVAALPRRQRTALVLHYYADLTFPQVADLMGTSENTAKSLARRALLALRAREDLVDLKESCDAV